ncbi:MAG: amidohydrolase family protein, partial [Candidatus Binatia bacterium]
MAEPKAIDCWINVTFRPPDGSVPEYLKRVAEDTFGTSPGFFDEATPDGLVEIMDRAGVEKVVLHVTAENPADRAFEFPRAHPGRFFLAVMPDVRRGMRALWDLEALVRDHPVVMARVVPMVLDLPPNDRIFYPLYAKCIEL